MSNNESGRDPSWTAAEDHSFVEVTGRAGMRVQVARISRDEVGIVILKPNGKADSHAVISLDALRLLPTVAPEQGDMRPMWTFEGDELRRLLDDLAEEPGWTPIYRVRFAVDDNHLKWKTNKDTWSAGVPADGGQS